MSPTTPRKAKLEWIAIKQIIPNEINPRTKIHFKEEELVSLKESVAVHGILQPILVQPYRDGVKDERFLIIEGERRFSVARSLGMKEIPAVVGDKQDDHDQLVTMFQIHTQHRGWEKAEELRAIQQLMKRNGDKSDDEMAEELGITVATFKNRLRVLEMGDDVVSAIAADKFDYSSALRTTEVASSLSKKRPKMVKKLGGRDAVQAKLLEKAEKRDKGISQELVEIKKDLTDTEAVTDEVVEEYIKAPAAKLRDLRNQQESLEERRQTEGLSRGLRRTAKEIEAFDLDLETVPNLRELRTALGDLVEAASTLENEVVEALLEKDE